MKNKRRRGAGRPIEIILITLALAASAVLAASRFNVLAPGDMSDVFSEVPTAFAAQSIAPLKPSDTPAQVSPTVTPSYEPEMAPPDRTPDRTAEFDARLIEKLDAAASAYGCVAVSLAVFDGNGYAAYQYGYADVNGRPADVNTKFRVASLSKLATAICAMALSDRGLIDLDADIAAYLGYLRNPNYPETPITCRMLMQHTSSIYDSEAFLSSRNSNSAKSTRRLLDDGSYRKREPGTRYEYANFGVAVLGAVCETVSDKSLDGLAREILFEPLGIDAAYVPENLRDTANIAAIYNESHKLAQSAQAQLGVKASVELGHDQHLAQGNLTISALDYARVLAMLTNGGSLGGVRILSEKAVREIHTADVEVSPYRQGLVVRYQEKALFDEDVYWHTGSNYGTFAQFIYNAETGHGAVVVTTGANPARLPNGMVKVCSALTELVWDPGEGGLPLSGMVVCVDPGHQGKGNSGQEAIAPGAGETKPKAASGTTGSFTKIPEYVLTLEVGLILRDKLEGLGARVVMTRTAHDVDISNAARAELANENGCDMVVRIHADGSTDPNVRGYSILVPGKKYTPDIVPESARFAEILDAALKGRVTIPSRGLITRDDLSGFNWLTVPGVLLEMGYMTNQADDETMRTPEFQRAVADAVAEALILYLGL